MLEVSLLLMLNDLSSVNTMQFSFLGPDLMVNEVELDNRSSVCFSVNWNTLKLSSAEEYLLETEEAVQTMVLA